MFNHRRSRRGFLAGSTIAMVGLAGCNTSVSQYFGSSDSYEWYHDTPGDVNAFSQGTIFGIENDTGEGGIFTRSKANGEVFALDAETGESKWTYGGVDGWDHWYSNLVVDDAVYFASSRDDSDGETHVVEFDGTERWTTDRMDLNGPSSAPYQILPASELVYVAGSIVRAFDKQNGEVRWRYQPERDFVSPPRIILTDDTLFILEKQVSAFDRESHQELWTSETQSDLVTVGAVIDGLVVVSGPDRMVAIDDGEERWTIEQEGLAVQGIVAGNIIARHRSDNTFRAFDPESGDERWISDPIPASQIQLELHNHGLYVGAQKQLYSIDGTDGGIRWEKTVGEEISKAQSMKVAGLSGESHAVYVKSDSNSLQRIAPDGEIRWTKRVDGDIGGEWVVEGQLLFIGTDEGVIALNAVE